MLRSVLAIQLMSFDPYRKATPLSLVALERSIEAVPDPTGNGSELLMRMWVSNRRTTLVTGNVEKFQGMRTPPHQRRDPPEIFLKIPRECEVSEVKTAR